MQRKIIMSNINVHLSNCVIGNNRIMLYYNQNIYIKYTLQTQMCV